jgi:hypothetical protein
MMSPVSSILQSTTESVTPPKATTLEEFGEENPRRSSRSTPPDPAWVPFILHGPARKEEASASPTLPPNPSHPPLSPPTRSSKRTGGQISTTGRTNPNTYTIYTGEPIRRRFIQSSSSSSHDADEGAAGEADGESVEENLNRLRVASVYCREGERRVSSPLVCDGWARLVFALGRFFRRGRIARPIGLGLRVMELAVKKKSFQAFTLYCIVFSGKYLKAIS